jgi:transposase InsO family protein
MNAQDLVDRTLLYHLHLKHPDWTIRRLAEVVDRSIGWVMKWLTRFRTEADSPDLFLDHPHSSPDPAPHTTSLEVMETILDLRDHPPESLRRVPGPKAILYYLERAEHLIGQVIPQSTRTIWRILKAANRIITTIHLHKERLDRPGPMEEWQMDFKDVTTVPSDPDGKRQHVVETLNIMDVGTDILVGAPVRGDFTAATVLPELLPIFTEYGLPDSLRFDRDTRFVGSAQQGDFPSALVRLLLCLDIQPIICRPHHPQENGVIERYQYTYDSECLQRDRPQDEAETRTVTEANRQRYNHVRPNQSVVCGNVPPCVAHPHPPVRRPLPDLADPDAWVQAIDGLRYRRKVQANTSISIDNHRYYTKVALIGQEVTVRVDAQEKALVIEHDGKEVKTVPIKGLANVGTVPVAEMLKIRVAEAEREAQQVRQRRAKTTKTTRSRQWFDRVSQAVAAAAASAVGIDGAETAEAAEATEAAEPTDAPANDAAAQS